MASKLEKARASARKAIARAEGTAAGNAGGAAVGGIAAGVLDGMGILNVQVIGDADIPLAGIAGGALILSTKMGRRSQFWKATAMGMLGYGAGVVGEYAGRMAKAKWAM